ncbi:unnamed protein product [Microthlaspi erraticum]|uniref:MADS-box domain-containing protein n=1 Tax=Microthlaspi erraticum TaxID=1685480 RepID=A0A6D2ILS0_9BRAS|nr:unnamed protein product [Microthlaspi erraticum]CAA7046089.1 unnamed protein product [Microthlaspi erraticum]
MKRIRNERSNKGYESLFEKSPEELNLAQAIQAKHAGEELKKKIDHLHYQHIHQTITPRGNYHVGSSSNVAPGAGPHGGNIYPNHNLFDQNRMMGTNPNMIAPNHTLPFGYNHNDNNVSERFVSDGAMNRTPWYNHSQIQNQGFEQGHPHLGPRYH